MLSKVFLRLYYFLSIVKQHAQKGVYRENVKAHFHFHIYNIYIRDKALKQFSSGYSIQAVFLSPFTYKNVLEIAKYFYLQPYDFMISLLVFFYFRYAKTCFNFFRRKNIFCICICSLVQ